MAQIGPFSIRFDQKKSDNSTYKETYVSGSDLIVITTNTGVITGSQLLAKASITELSASTATLVTSFFSGVTKFFNVIYAYAGVIGDVTGSISGSNAVFTTLTASLISGSVENSILLNNTASTVFATTGSNIFSGSQQITGSLIGYTGSFTNLFINNTGSTPTAINDGGNAGELRLDNNYLYIYTNNKWHRIPQTLWT